MKTYKAFLFLLMMSIVVSCSEEKQKPEYVVFEQDQDSLKVFIENAFLCPMFFYYKEKDQDNQMLALEGKERKQILSFSTAIMDSITVFDNYQFLGMGYGIPNLQSYDSLYNYGLPFLKNKRYKVSQGQDTDFTHKGSFSKYAIDFKMDVGQTVCAIREGVVVKVTQHHTKGGASKKYYPYANLIIIYHEDGTFAQYVHLKHKGSLVKVGDTVKKGQPIGLSGNTGQSTAPHLHFAVYKPTPSGLVSIPYILDSIPTERYKKGNYAVNN
jgi:murein DD-endopeptidase MepM/ murein hydrolase activator NlpD